MILNMNHKRIVTRVFVREIWRTPANFDEKYPGGLEKPRYKINIFVCKN